MKSSFAKLRKWFKSGSFKNNAPRKISSTRAHLALESLEVRTLLAGNALNDGPNVEFQITEDWNSGHTAKVVLANDDSSKSDTASRVCRCSRATCSNQFARP